MSDFDKRPEPGEKKDQSKQLVLVIVLGVVLLGVIVWQINKNKAGAGPAVANGSITVDAGAASIVPTGPEESASQLRASIVADSKIESITTGNTIPEGLKNIPRNPFHMETSWRASLTKVETIANTDPVKPQLEIKHNDPPPPANVAGLKLTMIVRQGNEYRAMLNNNLVSAGTIIGNIRVLEINKDSIVIQNAASTDGPTSTVKLENGMNP